MESTPKTFQRKLILYNLLIVICIASAVSFYNYTSYRRDVIATETNSSINRITNLSERMKIAYDEMINILLNCAERKSLFLTTTLFDYKEGYKDSKSAVYASNVLRDLCAISGYSSFIYKITLYNDGFILQAGHSAGASNDPEMIMKTPWFQEYLTKDTTQNTLFLVDNPFTTGKVGTPKILPLLRPLRYVRGGAPEDYWVFLGISPSLFQTAIQSMPADNVVYAVTKDGDVIASRYGDRYDTEALIRRLLLSKSAAGSFQTTLNRETCMVTYEKQSASGLLFLEILPIDSIYLDRNVIMNTIFIIFLFCIVIGLALSFLISRQMGSPISRLTKRLQLISNGDFEPDDSIETGDEIGMIGKQINHMSRHISTLLDTRVQDEKEKKDMEIKMLQAQINPHFLYNTLDSIKWIATMQKNSGIVQVVTSLSSLLKNMAKGFNEKITLRQELDFLQNYITIEKIRYIELFDVEVIIDDDLLYDAKIIKLTLQPIVENAIFSGIEPSGRFGLIKIHAFTRGHVLYVTVTDNGIGITPENIEKLLTDTSRITKSNMSGIGLPNVDRRLKLVYGEDFGITIESELDHYTTITISLPLEL